MGAALWCTGLVALRHVGSSQTWDRTYVPCIPRWILNHWAVREALKIFQRGPCFKIFIEFVTVLSLFYVLVFFLANSHGGILAP